MLKNLAHIISILSNPVVILGITFLLLLESVDVSMSQEKEYMLILAGSLAGVMLMYLATLNQYQQNALQHIDLSRRERIYILFTASIAGIINTGYHLTQENPDIAIAFMTLTFLFGGLGIATLFVTKASVHISTMMYCGIILLQDYEILGILLVLSVPLVMWSRVYLKKHTSIQLIIGFCLGVSSAILYIS